MNYSIWVTQSPERSASFFGVEISPRLVDIAAEGLCRALTTEIPEQQEADYRPSVTIALVTRNDSEGTALFIQTNDHDHGRTDTLKEFVGVLIADLMDPSGAHEISVGWSVAE